MAMDGPSAAGERPSLARIYGSRTMLVLLALGVAGGIPNVTLTTVSQAWVTDTKWELAAIGWLGFLTLPYALKFLWAPIVDGVRLPVIGRLGRRRSWLLASQAATAAAILALGIWGPEPMAGELGAHNLVFFALMAIAVACSATQDIVGDAYRADILTPQEMGAGASAFVTGYRIAFVVLGAGALILAEYIGWRAAMCGAGALMLGGVAATLAAREPAVPRGAAADLRTAAVAPLRVFWEQWRWRLVALVLFVLLFKLPDQLATAITTPLLMKGLGYHADTIGWVRQGFGFAMTVAGAGVGGWMVARLGLVRCLWVFGVMHCVSIAGFLWLTVQYGAHAGATPAQAPPVLALMPAIAVENFVVGLVTSGFVAFLMSICDRRFSATQYALLTALMALGNSVASGLSGALAERLDYTLFLVFAMCSGIPSLALIPLLRPPPQPAPTPVPAAPEPADSGPSGAEPEASPDPATMAGSHGRLACRSG